MKKLLIIVILLCLSSCLEYKDLVKKITPTDVDEFARHYISFIASDDYKSIAQYNHADLIKQFTPEILSAVHTELSKEPMELVDLIGSNFFANLETSNYWLTYQIKMKSQWEVVTMGIAKTDSDLLVTSFRVQPTTSSLEDANKLRFGLDTPIINYAALMVMIAVFVFMLTGVFSAVRSKIKKKYLWVLISLVSIFKIQVTWSTGQVAFNFITISLLGFGFAQLNPYSPWVVTVPLPMGAILFFLLKKKLEKSSVIDSEAKPANEKV